MYVEPGLLRPCRGCDGSNKKRHLSLLSKCYSTYCIREKLYSTRNPGIGHRGGVYRPPFSPNNLRLWFGRFFMIFSKLGLPYA